MIINFLQTRNPKILPALQQPPHYVPSGSSKNAMFCDDLGSVQGFGKDNKESLGDMLFGFFRRYAHEVNYEREVISVREGGLISKQDKKWHLLQNNRLGVEEPFNTDRNLGNTADDNAFRGVHLELRRAFDLISQGKLDECCEQYEFPAHEEKFWSKPVPQPRPILTRSQSQSGRPVKGGNNNSKGNSSGQRSRNGPSNRRASSAAAMNKMPMYPQMVNGDRPVSSNQIHDHLFHHYQILQQQEAQLRMQMHQRAQATLHAQVTAQVQVQQAPLQVNAVPYSQQANSENHRRHSNIDQPPLSAPLRSVQAYYYPVPMINQSPVQSLSPSLPTSQNATTPSSPSQASAQLAPEEIRRSLHRSTPADNSAFRSHSQPPANMKVYSQNGLPPTATVGPSLLQGSIQRYPSLQQYQQAYLQSRRAGDVQPSSEAPESVPMYYDQQDHTFRDYACYPMIIRGPESSLDFANGTRVYSAPSQRARTVSPNLSRLGRQTSRSPSPSRNAAPLGHSINFYSSESPPFQQYSRGMMGDGQTQASGPVIVDGSSDASEYATPPENIFYAVTSGPASTNSDDRLMDTPTSGSATTPMAEPADPFALDGQAERSISHHAPSLLQFGEFPARATFRSAQPPKPDDSKALERDPMPSIRKELAPEHNLNGLGIEVDSSKAFDKSLMSHNISQKPMHQSSTLSGLNLASTLKPLATLSPVREVRTPSPTATRGQNSLGESQNQAPHSRSGSSTGHKEPGPSPLAESSTASTDLKDNRGATSKTEVTKTAVSKGKEGQPLPNGVAARTAVKAPQRETQQQPAQAKSAQIAQASGWQQSTNKKKKNKKSASVGSAAIPQDPNERKGG